MANFTSPDLTSSALVHEALTRSARISKVLLDVSRSIESDSNLDSLWQRMHSGESNVNNPEPFYNAPPRSLPPSSPAISVSNPSRNFESNKIDARSSNADETRNRTQLFLDDSSSISFRNERFSPRISKEISTQQRENEASLRPAILDPPSTRMGEVGKSIFETDSLKSALIASRFMRKNVLESKALENKPLLDDMEALILRRLIAMIALHLLNVEN